MRPTDEVPPRISSVWPRCHVEPDGQRSIRSLKCLRDGAQCRPGQLTAERDRLRDRYAGELRVAAIEAATHTAHHRGDLLSDGQLATGTGSHDAGRLDSRDARECDVGIGEPEPGLELGAIQTEGLDLDEDPAELGPADGALAHNERLRRRRDCVKDDGAHGGERDHDSNMPRPAGPQSSAGDSRSSHEPRSQSSTAVMSWDIGD